MFVSVLQYLVFCLHFNIFKW